MDRELKRFFSDVENPLIVSEIVIGMRDGIEFEAERIPTSALPCMTILACIARDHFEETLVDDYARLMQRQREEMRECQHLDLCVASMIAINHQNNRRCNFSSGPNQHLIHVYKQLRRQK